jgi:hypothetical protein
MIINASVSIVIDISSQRLILKEDGELIRSFPISSSAYGEGQIENSLKTPYGKHIIKTKIGTNVDKNHFFVSREHIPQEAAIIHEPVDSKDDFITSRIMCSRVRKMDLIKVGQWILLKDIFIFMEHMKRG